MNDINSSSATTQSPGRSNYAPLLIVLALLAAAGVAGFLWFFDGGSREVYAATGEVYFNGEPVKTGSVEFVPTNKRNAPTRIVGTIKDDGTFELYTEFDDGLKKGAPAGTYKVLLMVYQAASFGPPAFLLPEKYYAEATTPITGMTVSTDPAKNHFVIKEAGELPEKEGERPRPEPEEPSKPGAEESK